MRKYIRLSLFVAALMSCMLMIVYQQKYSKLNVILQMMNAFSCKGSSANDSKIVPNIIQLPKSSWHLQDIIAGIPSWTEIYPGIYTYSTFWINEKTRTLVFVKGIPIAFAEELKCHLWYEDAKSSYLGEINFELMFKKNTSFLSSIKCKNSISNKIPYGISFTYSNTSLMMMLVINSASYSGQYSMCIEPLSSGYNNIVQAAEFLTYHHHIGIKHFIFYDKGILPKVKQLFVDIAPKYDVVVTLLPWNTPFDFQNLSEFNNEHFIDCFHRVLSRNHSDIIIYSNIDQFVVPKQNKSLSNLITSAEAFVGAYRLYESKFCSEYADDVIAHNLNISFITLLKTKTLTIMNYTYPVFFSINKLKSVLYSGKLALWLSKAFSMTNSVLSKELVSLHTYRRCNISFEILGKHYITNDFMWKFKDLFFKSQLCRFAEQKSTISSNFLNTSI